MKIKMGALKNDVTLYSESYRIALNLIFSFISVRNLKLKISAFHENSLSSLSNEPEQCTQRKKKFRHDEVSNVKIIK